LRSETADDWHGVMAVDELQQVINQQKEIVPGAGALVPGKADIGFFATAGPQFIKLPFAGQGLDRFAGTND